jgi:hypothetical protein
MVGEKKNDLPLTIYDFRFMKQIFFRITERTAQIDRRRSSVVHYSLLFAFIALLCVSCSDNYDNIREFSMKERVYPAHFDTVVGYPGYERVEILLSKDGRIPVSMMKLGKATKTIVKYDDKTKVFDSVCSWLNIDSLYLPKLYRFYVYSGDDDGNTSIPMEVAVTPYTSVDREALGVPNPEMSSFASFVMVNWAGGISSSIVDFLRLEYSYRDRDGVLRTGTVMETGTSQSRNVQFFVQNTNADEEVAVGVTCWVFPKIYDERILDSISFTDTIRVRKSSDAEPMDFAVSPSRMALRPGDLRVAVANIQYGLKWSSSNTRVATVNAYGTITARSPGTATITVTTEAIEGAVATVKVIVSDISAIPANDQLAGIWTFGDGEDLLEPELGLDLIPYGTQFTAIDGPNGTKGVRIGSSSYYGIKHGMSPNGRKKINDEGTTAAVMNSVNEYTLMMDIRIPASDYSAWKTLFNTQAQNVGDGIMWSNNGNIGKAEFGGQSEYGVLKPGTWHRVVFAVQLSDSKFTDVFHVYVDGEHVWQIDVSEHTEQVKATIAVGGKLSIYTNDILNEEDVDSDYLYIGADNLGISSNVKPAPDIAELRLWNVKLTDAQVKSLGGF